MQSTLLVYLLQILFFFCLSCSNSDLRNPNTLEQAKIEAIEISQIKKEFMYGMMWLYVDEDNNTFNGWVKESHPNQNLKSLGYLKNGQKQGLWISWYENGDKESDIEWDKDQYHGIFRYWFSNGKPKVVGQTQDGEVNGEWKNYYTNGQLNAHSINEIGKLKSIKVWRDNGGICQESKVEEGDGIFIEYDESGKPIRERIFKEGVEIKESSPERR